MVDLAYSEAELKEHDRKCCDVPMDYKGPKYPWGLILNLETDSLEKLGKSVADFKVGQKIPLMVMAEVQSISMNQTSDGDKHECVGLLCADIEFPSGGRSNEELASAIYKK